MKILTIPVNDRHLSEGRRSSVGWCAVGLALREMYGAENEEDELCVRVIDYKAIEGAPHEIRVFNVRTFTPPNSKISSFIRQFDFGVSSPEPAELELEVPDNWPQPIPRYKHLLREAP